MTATQPRPGSVVISRSTPPPRTVPVDTSAMFVVGLSDKGPLKPVLVTSLQDFVNQMGGRVTYSILYDAMELFFREGGARAYVSRVVGVTPVIASVNLDDATPGGNQSLVVKAKGPGAYANTLRITVTGGGGTAPGNPYTITVSDTVLGTLEISPTLLDQNAALAWSQQSSWVDITLGASADNPVAVSLAPLAGGTDDRGTIVDANWATALNRFTRDYGPGQVTAPGRTTTVGLNQLRDHAAANNRWALLDLPDSAVVATVTGASTGQRNGTTDRYGMAWGPWLVAPGLFPFTTRVIPPSTGIAAKIAAMEGLGNSPNKPAAGNEFGIFNWANLGLSQVAYDNGTGIDVTRDAMYDLGVNLIVQRYGVTEAFGWRSLSDPNGVNQDWVNAGNGRLNMAIVAKGLAVAENYILDEIDGQGRLMKQFEGDLVGMLAEFYVKGSLFGPTPEQAFIVDTGPTVNTPLSLSNRELHAAISCRMSPNAELVIIEVSKVPISQSL